MSVMDVPRLTQEIQLFITIILRTIAMSADVSACVDGPPDHLGFQDLKFAKQFDNDKTNKSKMLKAMFSVHLFLLHTMPCLRLWSQAFNGGIAALQSQQKEWRIAYASLREELDKLILTTVMNSYSEFHSANSTVNFSRKHMDQYVKYAPKDIEQLLYNYFKHNS